MGNTKNIKKRAIFGGRVQSISHIAEISTQWRGHTKIRSVKAHPQT